MKLNCRNLFLTAVALILLLNGSVASAFYDPVLGRWLNRDPIASTPGMRLPGPQGNYRLPIERVIGPNLYAFAYNSPANYVDPNGLWGVAFGNNSGSSYFNFGIGNPNLYFSPNSGNGVGQSAAATADGINPFGNPFANNGYYDPNDPYNQFSHGAGKVAQVCLTSAAGLGLAKLYTVPQYVYHYTSIEGATGILADGGIAASSSGIGGAGTYFTSFASPLAATLQGAASTEAVVIVDTSGLTLTPTLLPGTFVLRGASLLVP